MGIVCCLALVLVAAGGGGSPADRVELARGPAAAPHERHLPSPHPIESVDGLHWRGLVGAPAPDRVYVGLWTLHLRSAADGLSPHWLMAIGWRGTVAGTFVNSHGDRSWMAGFAREVATWQRGTLGASAGYRLGVIRGYDERLHRLAGQWPVVPAGEVVGTIRRGRVGATVSYAGIVTSVGGFVWLGER